MYEWRKELTVVCTALKGDEMKKCMFVVFCLLLGNAFASVAPVGKGIYLADRNVMAGDVGAEGAKAVVLAEAMEFCLSKGLVPRVRETAHVERGGASLIKVEFECVTKASRPPLSSFQK
jgi:hypothetical protein